MTNENAQLFRNTPCLVEEGFLEECRVNQVGKVTKECFERTLRAQALEEGQEDSTTGMLCMLEVLEDYNYAYIFDNQYFMGAVFVARHALI